MMKRLLALLLCLTLFSAAAMAESKVTVTGTENAALPESITGLNVTWLPAAAGTRLVMTWQSEGNDYEACLNGLTEELTEAQIAQLLYAWSTRSHAVIEGGLTDAEKYTNRLSARTGDWVVTDTEERKLEDWGDSSLCWAAAASNMLWITGWAQKATDPQTGKPFASEDDVFAMFTRRFINDGGWSDHGVRWFFNGKLEGLDLRDRWTESLSTCVEGEDPATYLHGTLDQDNPNNTEPADIGTFVSVVRSIRDGAAVGMSVGFNEETYHMPGDTNDSVWWSVQRNSFVRSRLIDAAKEECVYGPYCFDDMSDPMPLTLQADGSYLDEAGNTVDRLAALNGYLYNNNGTWLLATPFGEDGEMLITEEIPVPEDAFDHNDMTQEQSAAHMHAITLTGYVMNLSAADPAEVIEAMFIVNSDDDAALWHIYPDTPSREDRRNVCQMYPTSVHTCDEGTEQRTICLEQFMKHNLTLINHMVALDAAE